MVISVCLTTFSFIFAIYNLITAIVGYVSLKKHTDNIAAFEKSWKSTPFEAITV